MQHILQHLLPSTVTLLEKNALDLRHQVQNHQPVLLLPVLLVREPTPTGHNTSITAGSHREGARQLKVILYTLEQSSSAAQDKSVTQHPQHFLGQTSAVFAKPNHLSTEKFHCLILGSDLALLLTLIQFPCAFYRCIYNVGKLPLPMAQCSL